MKKAIIIGASGLVGRHLLSRLLDDIRVSQVLSFVRRPMGLEHEKLTEHIIDFDHPEKWQHLVRGDVLYSCLGTTRAQAGGKMQQYKVDYGLQFQFAAAAARHKVSQLVLVSSVGARLDSGFFYMRMKAELERDVSGLPFERIVIVRPGPLFGKRRKQRLGESLGVFITRSLNRIGLIRSMRPISGDKVARAMVNASFMQGKGLRIYESDELFSL